MAQVKYSVIYTREAVYIYIHKACSVDWLTK